MLDNLIVFARKTSSTGSGNAGGIIGAIVILAIIGFFAFRYFTKRHDNISKREREYGTRNGMHGILVSGLPVAEGAEIEVVDAPSELTFVRGNSDWKIPKDRIVDIASASGSELKSAVKDGPDTRGALAGFLFAGIPGALIGALPNSHYLVVAYKNSAGEDATILVKWKESSSDTVTPKKIAENFARTRAYQGGSQSTTL